MDIGQIVLAAFLPVLQVVLLCTSGAALVWKVLSLAINLVRGRAHVFHVFRS